MIVRCGRCHVELEVSGPGEFACPACGARNAVRDGASRQPASYDVGGLSVPGYGGPADLGASRGYPPGNAGVPVADGLAQGINWRRCPNCSYRFAMGEVEHVTCPNCAARLEVTEAGLQMAQA